MKRLDRKALHRWCLAIALFLWSLPAVSDTFPFTILHTNDLHSSFIGSGPDSYFTAKVYDGDPVRGHYARLLHLIKKIKAKKATENEPVLLLDAGDFYAGSLFHLFTQSKKYSFSAELDFFHQAGYDAVTIGNHEFDAEFPGFFRLLEKKVKNNYNFSFVSSNIVFPLRELNSKQLKLSREIKPYIIKELSKGDQILRVGIIGALGFNGALICSVSRGNIGFIGHNDEKDKSEKKILVTHLQKIIDHLRLDKAVDIVILLSHAGEPEDSYLSENLQGLNLFIGGHAHDAYKKVRLKNNVIIAQAGEKGHFLGRLELAFSRGSNLALRNDEVLLPVDDSIPVEPQYFDKIEEYKEHINEFLNSTEFTLDTPIFKTKVDMKRVKEAHNPYGTFVSSIILKSFNATLAEDADLYLTTIGMIRDNIRSHHKENAGTLYQLSDVFRIFSMGFGSDYSLGSPIVSFYMKKGEVRSLLNFLEIYRRVSPRTTPAYSNSVQFSIRKYGIPFVNRLKDLRLHGKPYQKWPKLIKVIMTKRLSTYFPKVTSVTYGLVELPFRNARGKIIQKPKMYFNAREYLLFAKEMEGKVLSKNAVVSK